MLCEARCEREKSGISPETMNTQPDEFIRFEHTGWQCVADKYAMRVFARPDGLLARQSPETLDAIRMAIENGIKRYRRGNELVLPMAAHIVVVGKG